MLNPPTHCSLCPRLVNYRNANALEAPQYWNQPVDNFGDPLARYLIIGLAPGKKGANYTNRPFWMDGAGDLLYPALLTTGLAEGVFRPNYEVISQQQLKLRNLYITNLIRCAPPSNQPLPCEIQQCKPFLQSTVESLPQLETLITLGTVAFKQLFRAYGQKCPPFIHGAYANLTLPSNRVLKVVSAYHPSRYNQNTGLVNAHLYEQLFKAIQQS